MQILSVIIGLGLLWLAYKLTPLPTPPDDDPGDDWGGGSDRMPPMTPWWPPGVSPEPEREKELV